MRKIQRCTKKIQSPFDRITEDGILLLIVSLLPLREAVRTSALSRRWRYIWTQLPKLRFNVSTIYDTTRLGLSERRKLRRDKPEQFISIVNSVLQQHQGIARIDEFMFRYHLGKIHSNHLDSWLRFVVASKSKILFLYLERDSLEMFDDRPEHYDFPCHMLGSSPIEHLRISCCSLKPPHGFDGIRSLKILYLSRLDITEQDVLCLLSNCFTLEDLTVDDCPRLVTLTISHHLSRLEKLAVTNIKSYNNNNQLKTIHIDATNLIVLHYWGTPVDFRLTKSSQLTDATVRFQIDRYFDLTRLSKGLPCLKYLHFELQSESQVTPYLGNNSCRFLNLKHLKFQFSGRSKNDRDYLCLDSLLSIAPFIEKFTLNCSASDSSSPRMLELKHMKQRRGSPHTHLKKVEINGFTGDKRHILLAKHLLNCAIQLESLALRKSALYKVDQHSERIIETNMEYLRGEVPTNVELVVLCPPPVFPLIFHKC